MSDIADPTDFIVTKEHRRFVEFCDACRRYCYIGLCYGTPGVGKTVSARTYARQDSIEDLLATTHLLDLPTLPEVLKCVTVFYTPSVAHSPVVQCDYLQLPLVHQGANLARDEVK
jgi:hypothetical protein